MIQFKDLAIIIHKDITFQKNKMGTGIKLINLNFGGSPSKASSGNAALLSVSKLKSPALICMLSRRNFKHKTRFALVINFWHSQFNSLIKLSQEEILDISQEINQEFPSNVSSTNPELVILPVDPYHLYAYWNLGINLNAYWNVSKSGQSPTSEDELDNHLTLRIYSQPSHGTDPDKTKIWFDVPINGSQTQKKVRLPSYETAYSAAIGKRYPDDRFVVFAYSGIINVPPGRRAPNQPRKNIKESVTIMQVILPPDGQANASETTPQSTDNAAINDAIIENTSPGADNSGSLNPEIGKGIEVSLTPEKNISAHSIQSNATVKHYDETLICHVNKHTFSDNNIAEPRSSKIEHPEKFHFASKHNSGRGCNP